MRDIKFRLFNKYDKEMYIFEPKWGNYGQGSGWISGVLVKDYKKEGRIFAPSNQIQLEPEGCEWMQFTGLLDKNGTEIYEGDIVKAGGSMAFSNPNVHQGLVKIVKWLESGFTLVEKQDFDIPNLMGNIDNYQFWNVHRDLEVIGNIYENPELLEVDNVSKV